MDEQNESFKEMQKISFLKTNEKNELLKIVWNILIVHLNDVFRIFAFVTKTITL